MFLTLVNFARKMIWSTPITKPDRYWRKEQYFRMTAKMYGRRRNCRVFAVGAARRQMRASRVGRKFKKLYMQKLQMERIEAACMEHGLQVEVFMETLQRSNILLNKKVLSELAIYEPRTFQSLTEFAKQRSQEIGLNVYKRLSPHGIVTRGML